MTKKVKALVRPELLKWARESAGLSPGEAAKKIGRPVEEIIAWEKGELSPSVAQARKAAESYKRPLAVFYLPERPTDFQPLGDFRRLPKGAQEEFSFKLRMLIRRAHEHQDWVRQNLEIENANKIAFIGTATVDEDVVNLANQIRDSIGVTAQRINKSANPDDALKIWIDAVENSGVYVFQSGDIDPVEARGFVVLDDLAPFIFINSKDSRSARIFTLLHELVHIWLGKEGVSNLVPIEGARSENENTEIFCNAVAAEVIAPSVKVLSSWRKTNEAKDLHERIHDVAREYRVSREVIARILLNNRVIERDTYMELRETFNQEWREYKDKQKLKPGAPPYVRRVAQTNGRTFTKMVISAYNSGELTGRDLSGLLNMKLNHIPKLIAEIS